MLVLSIGVSEMFASSVILSAQGALQLIANTQHQSTLLFASFHFSLILNVTFVLYITIAHNAFVCKELLMKNSVWLRFYYYNIEVPSVLGFSAFLMLFSI
jgi:hypothetical protein